MTNDAGVFSTLEAVFFSGESEIRRTNLLLAPNGVDSIDEVLSTVAETIEITAHVALLDQSLPDHFELGQLIIQRTLRLGIDYQFGETIKFIIPDVGLDCNGNNAPDSAEIAAVSA